MKRIFMLFMILVLAASLIACGSGSTTESAPSESPGMYDQASEEESRNQMSKDEGYEGITDGAAADIDAAGGSKDYESTVYGGGFFPDAAQKIIYYGDISLETERFDETMSKIDAKVAETGSYIESSSIRGTGKSEYDLRYASIVIRVPAGRFDDMKKAADEWGTVTGTSTSSQDVTKQYIDTEARIKTLKIQEERLLMLLGKAEKVEDIIILEGRLSDIRLQIEGFTGTLKELDALVDYATIGITIREVKSETYIPQNFGQRLLEAVRDSLRQLGQTLENSIVGLIYLAPYIIVLIVLILIIKRTGIFGKVHLLRHKKNKDQNPGE